MRSADLIKIANKARDLDFKSMSRPRSGWLGLEAEGATQIKDFKHTLWFTLTYSFYFKASTAETKYQVGFLGLTSQGLKSAFAIDPRLETHCNLRRLFLTPYLSLSHQAYSDPTFEPIDLRSMFALLNSLELRKLQSLVSYTARFL